MARRAALYQTIHDAADNVLVVDGGNLFGLRKESERKQTMFLCEETEKLDYDVFGVGSNELNYGLEFLREMESRHSLKFVNANLRNGGGELLFEPWTVVERGGVKFAFISVIAPRYKIVTMTADNDEFVIDDPREAIERHLPEMQQAADIVVLLAQMPSASVREMLTGMGPGSGIDICIEGRDARQYRRINRVNGDVILLAANNEGKYVGQLDLVEDALAHQPRRLGELGAGVDPQALVGILEAERLDRVAIDLPGHGLTGPRADGDYSTAAFAGLVERLLDHLEDSKKRYDSPDPSTPGQAAT